MPIPPKNGISIKWGDWRGTPAGHSNMEKQVTLGARVELESLVTVTTFVSAAEHLKSLTLQLAELRQRRSRREHSLALQIQCITTLCDERAAESPHLADLWRLAQAEIKALSVERPPAPCPHAAAPTEPCKGGTP